MPPSTARLLGAGAAVDAVDGDGHCLTPLMLAAQRNRLDVVRALVEHGAKLDAADAEGNTPLAHALGRGADEALLTLLIERGGKKATRAPRLLTLAALRSSVGMVQLLLDAGVTKAEGNRAIRTLCESARQPGVLDVFDDSKFSDERGHIYDLLLEHGYKSGHVAWSSQSSRACIVEPDPNSLGD
jgi:ankyrin repeat protein